MSKGDFNFEGKSQRLSSNTNKFRKMGTEKDKRKFHCKENSLGPYALYIFHNFWVYLEYQ